MVRGAYSSGRFGHLTSSFFSFFARSRMGCVVYSFNRMGFSWARFAFPQHIFLSVIAGENRVRWADSSFTLAARLSDLFAH